MKKQITIRVKTDSAIKVVAYELDKNRGVITTDGCLYKRSEYSYCSRVYCHFCQNRDEVAFVNTFFGVRACCRFCKPVDCCSIPGCRNNIHSTHMRRGQLYAYCYIHYRKSEFFDGDDAYAGVSDEGVIASDKLWLEISNRGKYSEAELIEYSQLLKSYR